MKNKEGKQNNIDLSNTFSDIMSRSERKKMEKMLLEEKKEKMKNDEKQDINLIDKNFDETLKKEHDKNKLSIEKKKEKIRKNETEISNKNIGKNIFAIICLILSISYSIFTVIFCGDQVNNLYLIINAIVITIFALFLTIMVITKNYKTKNVFSYFTTIILSGFLIFNFLVLNNNIELPTQELLENFQNKTISEALKWAKENNIEVNQIYEYSDNIEEYHIITQDIYPNTLLKKVDKITFTVSYGPNYDKIISLPNMVGWNIDDAMKTINDNFLNNVNIDYEVNEEKEKDTIIEQSISGQIRRNDEVNIKVSLGSTDDLEPVEMINLKNKSLMDATLWLKRHGIKYELVYVFSDEIVKNYVADQETDSGETVNPKDDTVKLIISKGKKIVVPDLTKLSVDEATEWIINNNLKVKFETKYDSNIEAGKIIEADYKENDEIEAGTLITITTSKGPLKMPKFNNISDLRNWANNLGIEYREEYEFNDNVNKGDIIKTIPEENAVINYSDVIIVHISYGKPVTVPSFIGKSKSEISSTCNNIGLNCTFYYNGYSDTPYDIAQNQNKNAGSEVVSGTYVSIGLSSGPKPKEEPKPDSTPTCDSSETRPLIIQQNWITGGSANATINTLKTQLASRYPKVTFKFEIKEGNRTPGLIHEDSPTTNKTMIQDCKEYTIIINE